MRLLLSAALRTLAIVFVALAVAELFSLVQHRPSEPAIMPLEVRTIAPPTTREGTPLEERSKTFGIKSKPPPLSLAHPAPAPLPAPAMAVAPPPEPELNDQEFYQRFASAIIQIYCTTPEELFTASGVIINERGLVLTNAHVAAVVTEAGAENCQARHGNPADPFAGIELVYIANTAAKIAGTTVPQRDVAFLRITEPREPFSAAPVALVTVAPGTIVRTLGYPSEFLQSVAASRNSNLVFSNLSVDGAVDVDDDLTTGEGYSFHGGIALQQGSSGTPLFKRNGAVVGLVSATTRASTTAAREGLALTTPYFDSVLRTETGQGLLEFIAADH